MGMLADQFADKTVDSVDIFSSILENIIYKYLIPLMATGGANR